MNAEYLKAKESVDGRSLNRSVAAAARRGIMRDKTPTRILELGCGTGAMLRHWLGGGWEGEVEYTGIDHDPTLLNAALEAFAEWAEEPGRRMQGEHKLVSERWSATVALQRSDAYEFLQDSSDQWDLILAHAFLDLVDLPVILQPLLTALAPSGLFYFSMSFDGTTLLLPQIEHELDEKIVKLYHASMDHPDAPAAHSQTGRHLLKLLPELGAEILASGPSDWFLYPKHRSYRKGEATFLRTILGFIEGELTDHPALKPSDFKRWLRRRHEQLRRGELLFIARQIDVAGRMS